jgi:uncharacterized protein (TIGR00255 family)
MVISMTGFATKTLTLIGPDGSHANLSFMLKSLNSRYLETHCKLPFALTYLETEFIKIFKQKLLRGSIQFVIQVNNPMLFKGAIHADLPTVKGYLRASDIIKKQFDVPGIITIADLFRLPNLFISEEEPLDKEKQNLILKTVEELTDKLLEVRKIEGVALLDDLKKRVCALQSFIDYVEMRAQIVMEIRKREIAEQLAKLEKVSSDFAETQRNVLYLELDRIDIHEEIIRFKNHLVTFNTTLLSDMLEKGRRLDFILQELNRETNTIAAKCADAEISSLAINIKVEVEKAREQVQNIV